jgi:hypothetical protein
MFPCLPCALFLTVIVWVLLLITFSMCVETLPHYLQQLSHLLFGTSTLRPQQCVVRGFLNFPVLVLSPFSRILSCPFGMKHIVLFFFHDEKMKIMFMTKIYVLRHVRPFLAVVTAVLAVTTSFEALVILSNIERVYSILAVA